MLIGFLSGSIPFVYLMVKVLKGQDIRKIGSGNIGATNVGRALGKWGFISVMLLDALKGLAPVLLARLFFGNWVAVATGAAAMAGHMFTPWLGFKGGKGVATGLGVFIGLSPVAAAAAAGAWVLVVLLTRFVSVASISAGFVLFLYTTFIQGDLALSVFSGVAFLAVWFSHRSNIKRLLNGTENRVQFGSKRKKERDRED